MINRRLSSAEAASRLGVKPETLYAYVSRGLLHPERTSRGSTFDAHEVAHLARTGRNARGAPANRGAARLGEPGSGDPVFLTELTLIDRGHLYYRGLDAVVLSRTRTFEEVATWLWTGEWSGAGDPWAMPSWAGDGLPRSLAGLPPGTSALERFMVAAVAASLRDELRFDLTPAGVAVTGRGLMAVLTAALPLAPVGRVGEAGAETGDSSISARVWQGLTERPVTPEGVGALEAALVLAADHELAPSTLAARVAASFRADPYAVVLTGLGPASGSMHAGSTGAPTEVELLLAEAAALGPERAIGDRIRRTGETPHGFGMPLYPDGDPRGGELLRRLEGAGDPERLEVVKGLLEVGLDRGFPPPNFDLGLGALAYCAGMVPGAGQAVFTLGKVVGWLAHAMEEYSAPTRFRSRADYVGPHPEAAP